MTRRQLHNRIGVSITLPVFAVAFYFLWNRQPLPFIITCGLYFVFMLIYLALCWLNVPKDLRKRPPVPREFSVFRIGSSLPADSPKLTGAVITREGTFSKARHQLFLMERTYQEGVWRCEVEVADGRILAYLTAFESIASPVMDSGKQRGAGQFLTVITS